MLLTVCYLLDDQYFWINPGLESNSFHVAASSKLEEHGVVELRNCDNYYVLDKYWDRLYKKDLLIPRIDSIDDIKKINECLLDMGDYQIIKREKTLIPVIV